MKSPAWLLVFVCVCSSPRLAEVDRTEFAFGSYVRIKALGLSRHLVEETVGKAFAEMFRLDTLWSSFLPESEVSALNRTGGCRVAWETRELVASALDVGARTGGALDITVRPILDCWGITGDEWRLPESAELGRARRRVGFRRVAVSGDSLVLGDGAQIDLGAVAVGFAVDRATELLKAGGVEQGLVDAGGDIRVFGRRVWRIGLKNPRGEGTVRVFRLKDRAVSTSGDYQKFFEARGRRYHHIIDPRTGYPADKCCSVTILAPTALEADAYATAVFVLGPEAGLEVVRGRPGLAGVILVEDADSLVTFETEGLR